MPETYLQRMKQGWGEMGVIMPSAIGRIVTILRFGTLIAPEAFQLTRAVTSGESPDEHLYLKPERIRKFGKYVVKFGGELPESFSDHPE